MAEKKQVNTGVEKKGGYQAGPKTPSQVKRPPAAFVGPKRPAASRNPGAS